MVIDDVLSFGFDLILGRAQMSYLSWQKATRRISISCRKERRVQAS